MKRNFKRIFALCTTFVLLFQNAVYTAFDTLTVL